MHFVQNVSMLSVEFIPLSKTIVTSLRGIPISAVFQFFCKIKNFKSLLSKNSRSVEYFLTQYPKIGFEFTANSRHCRKVYNFGRKQLKSHNKCGYQLRETEVIE